MTSKGSSSGVVWLPGRTPSFRHITRSSTRGKTVKTRGSYEKDGFEIFGELDNLPRGSEGYFLGELFETDMKATSLTLSLRENEALAIDYLMSDGICYRMTSHPDCSPSAGLHDRLQDRRLELAVRPAGQQRPSRLCPGIRLRSRPEVCLRLPTCSRRMIRTTWSFSPIARARLRSPCCFAHS